MSRALFAGGVAGATETRVVARVCCWCDVPHFLTPTDRQAREQGAPASHGMCPAAGARVMGELARAAGEEQT
ncbi:MAG: hypothetical protein AMXMBFR53_36600 [Gemmatimonadota bacterium]